MNGIQKKKPRNLKEALLGRLTEEEMAFVKRAFDTLGDTAILEIPSELKKKEKKIALALTEVNTAIKSVYAKKGATQGEFRIQPLRFLAGEKKKFAQYRENGCTFRISLGKVFFSPRLSTERLRIAREIQKDEVVAALFAGVGPFPIVFAKNSPMKKAFAVELNPVAVEDMKENLRLNKAENKIEIIEGDVKEIVPKYLKGKCNRVVMPLPKTGSTFLSEAFECLKPSGGIIHFYFFGEKTDPFGLGLKAVKEMAKEKKKKTRVLFKRVVRPFSARTDQIVIDFKVTPRKPQ
ncbi:MAG: class I SAM-dependent methyltransferase family protein [Candidatus Diapherotrites archaeon]|nr:class I SAM-dependent methyltransferase family protein [Candidatus Diapherotrites archaeon]